MARNKVIFGNETLIDLTGDTAVESDVASGKLFHKADGTQAAGTASGPSLQTKTNITPTTSSQTITPDQGYDGLSSVQINAMPSGTAGTPTTSKSISGQTATITPSVTNTTGYITGSTKTGTAVTVTASELVSFVTYYTSPNAPSSSQGNNGDIWLKTVS